MKLTTIIWRWRQHIPPKHLLHCVIFQKRETFITTCVRSDPTCVGAFSLFTCSTVLCSSLDFSDGPNRVRIFFRYIEWRIRRQAYTHVVAYVLSPEVTPSHARPDWGIRYSLRAGRLDSLLFPQVYLLSSLSLLHESVLDSVWSPLRTCPEEMSC
jgi:hypothetical protein